MKKLHFILIILLVIAAVFLAKNNLFAGDLTLTPSVRYDMYTSEDIDANMSLNVKLKHDTGIYLLLGASNGIQIRKGTQQMMEVDDYQLSFGIDREVVNGLSVYGHIGYHFIQDEMDGSYHEAVNYYWRRRLPGETKPNWDTYCGDGNDIEYTEIANYIGGEIGVNFDHDITDNCSFGLNLAYRIGSPTIYTKYYNQKVIDSHGIWWELKEDIDFGGPSAGITFSYNF